MVVSTLVALPFVSVPGLLIGSLRDMAVPAIDPFLLCHRAVTDTIRFCKEMVASALVFTVRMVISKDFG